MLQSTGDKINSFLLSENPKLFINKEKKVPDLSSSHLVCVGMGRVLILLLTLHSSLSTGHFVQISIRIIKFLKPGVTEKTLV